MSTTPVEKCQALIDLVEGIKPSIEQMLLHKQGAAQKVVGSPEAVEAEKMVKACAKLGDALTAFVEEVNACTKALEPSANAEATESVAHQLK